jgi:class 3 adenylate cyclase
LEAHSVERKLAAIFAADVEGYSRLMGLDEVGTLRTLTAYRVIIDRLIASHRPEKRDDEHVPASPPRIAVHVL